MLQLCNMTDPITKVHNARRAQQEANTQLRSAVAEAVRSGVPKTTLARELGINRLTVYRWLEEEHDEHP